MNRTLTAGSAIVLVFVVLGLFGTVLAPYDPMMTDYGAIFDTPSSAHLFGTDHLGRDTLSRLLAGTKTTLGLALLITIANIAIAMTVGSLSGFFGGRFDTIVMRVVDSLIALPGFLIAICFLGIFGGGIRNLAFFLIITGWAGLARVIRNEVIVVKNMDFIVYNVSLGFGNARIILGHILPHVIPPLLIVFISSLIGELFSIVSLSFLGLGISPSTPEWGAILNNARPYFLSSPSLLLFPTLFIFAIVFGLHLVADGLRDFMDSKKLLIAGDDFTRYYTADETPIGDTP